MPKSTHKEAKFTKEEMAYDIPDELDLKKHRFVGRGRVGIEMARRISSARGESKRRLIESLPYVEEEVRPTKAMVELQPDVAAVFKDSDSVNAALRTLIKKSSKQKLRKTG